MLSRITAAVVVLLGSGGCGGSAGSPSSTSTCDGGCWSPSASDQAFIDSFCSLRETCCVASGQRTQPDLATCSARLRTSGFTRDEALRAACLTSLQELAETQSCFPDLNDFTHPCLRTFDEPSGPQRPGAVCATAADCAGAPNTVTLCSRDPSTLGSRRICMRLAFGRPGDKPCLGAADRTGVIVAAPFYMASSTVAPISTGVVCERSAELYCEPADDPDLRTCSPLLADGSTCSYPMTCASGSCITASGGQATGPSSPGTCVARVPLGATCTGPGLNVRCDDATYCNAGTCAAKLPAGATCTDDSWCTSDNCVNHVCSSRTDAQAMAVFAFCS